MHRVLLTLALIAALMSVAAPAHPATGDGAAELDLLRRINVERVQRGLAPVRMADDLRSQARKHSYEMAANGRLAHTANLGKHVCCWRTLGENVAVGDSLREIHRQLMRSSAHRSVILDPDYREIGIGVVRKGHRFWVTQDLRERV